MFDLASPADEMTRLLRGVREKHLAARTPCEEWNVADLLTHVQLFTTVFTHNARKEDSPRPHTLAEDWRESLPAAIESLAEAWRAESAWHGELTVGGQPMAAGDNAVVCVEELVVHGWDLARATGQDFHAAETSLDRIDGFFGLFGESPFGPEKPAPDGADRLERTIARTGRDPRWSATA